MTYETTAGTFYVAFRATDTAVLHIGMLPNVRAVNVSMQYGSITNVSVNTWGSNSVTLFAWPGSGVVWNGVFQSNVSIAAVVVISGGQIAPGITVLPAPDSQPNPQPKPTATPTATPTSNEPGTTETFTNGNVTLIATTTTSGNSKITVVKNQQGQLILTAVLTMDSIKLSYPGYEGTKELNLTPPLPALSNDHTTNQTAAYIAEQILSENQAKSLKMKDHPGCNLFPDDTCTLPCCAVHDACYYQNNCKATSWLPILGSDACDRCNSAAARCIKSGEKCNQHPQCFFGKCAQPTLEDGFYDCPAPWTNTCNCASPCLVTPTPTATPTPGELSLKLICNGSETSCGNINMGEHATLEMHWVNPKKDGGKISIPVPCAPLGDLELNISIPTGVLSGIAYAQVGHRYRDCYTGPWEDNTQVYLNDGSGGSTGGSLMKFWLIGDNPNALLICDGCIKAK